MPKREIETGETRVPSVLVVENDEILGDNLARFIGGRMGWKVDLALGVKEGRSMLERAQAYDVVLSDMILRDGNGLDLANQVRGLGTKVIMMSGAVERGIDQASVADLVYGCLPKPFHLSELGALLLEAVGITTGPDHCWRTQKNAPPLRLEQGCRVSLKGEILEMKLTPIEQSILKEFVQNFGGMVLKEGLYERIYSKGSEYGKRKLDVHVHNLRKKLEKASGNEVQINTVRSQGFVLELSSSKRSQPRAVSGKSRKAKQP